MSLSGLLRHRSKDAHKVKKMQKCSYRNALFKWASVTLPLKILCTSYEVASLVLASCVQAQRGVCWHLSAFLVVQAVGHEFLSFFVSGEKNQLHFVCERCFHPLKASELPVFSSVLWRAHSFSLARVVSDEKLSSHLSLCPWAAMVVVVCFRIVLFMFLVCGLLRTDL